MRFSIAALITGLASLAAAQLSDLPPCAQTCVGNGFAGCGSLDIRCICSNTQLISELSCCIARSCNAADAQRTIQFASGLCSTYQITLPTSAVCSSASPSATSGGAPSASGATANSTMSMSPASSSAASAASSTPTRGAATREKLAGSGVGLGVAIAGLLAAF